MSFSLLHSNLNTHTHDQHPHLILEFSGFIILIPECYTPLGLTVVPTLRRLSSLAKHTTSTTSPRGSFLATSPPLSYPLTTRMPSPPASVRRRLAASTPLFPNIGHPRDRRELLNLFPHFSLAAGEPPRRNWVAVDWLLYVARPGTQLQEFKSFQGPFCGKSVPPFQNSQL
jgi:hypothetical protein